MKFVYLDESGISNQKHEPTVVVAGVMIDADKQALAVEARLEEIMKNYAPKSIQEHGICFHAKELYSGGKLWDRDKITPEQRFKILKKLCQIPALYGLPVFYGSMNREAVARALEDATFAKPTENSQYAQSFAAVICMLQIEKYMRENSGKTEVATMVFEYNKEAEKLIKNSHYNLKFGPRFPVELGGLEKYQPIRRIIDAPHFVEKRGSSLIQIADVLAFFIKRILGGDKQAIPFFDKFKIQLFGVAPDLLPFMNNIGYRGINIHGSGN